MAAARIFRAWLSALALLVLAPQAMAGSCVAHDSWQGRDKQVHALAGAAVAGVATVYTGSAWQGFAAGVAVAAAKELTDTQVPRGHCTLQDFLATVAGAAIGAPAGLVFVPTRGGARVTYTRSW